MNVRNIVIIILFIMVFTVGGLYLAQQMAIGEESLGFTQIPLLEQYTLEPRQLSTQGYQDVVFNNYVFKITQYDDMYQVPYCKNAKGSNCEVVSIENGCDVYECTTFTQRVTCPRWHSKCQCCTSGNCRGCGGLFCSASEFRSCTISQVPQTTTSGGSDIKYIDGAGIKWELFKDGDRIDGQTELLSKELNTENLIALENFYEIKKISSGVADKNGYPFMRIGLKRILHDITYSINLQDTYKQGDVADVNINICNDDTHILYGVVDILYEFDTFIGTLDQTEQERFSIMAGCNDYPILFGTDKSTTNVKVSTVLKIYENGYSGILVNREKVLDYENENFDRILVNTNNYLFLETFDLGSKDVTILPQFTKEELNTLEDKVDSLTLILNDQDLEIDEKLGLISTLNISESEKQQIIESLESDKQTQEEYIKVLEDEKNKSKKVIIVLLSILSLIGLIWFIKALLK